MTNIITPNFQLQLQNTSDINVRHNDIGDICSVICNMENGLEIVIVAVYMSPNKTINDIIQFIHRHLLEYTDEGSALLNSD